MNESRLQIAILALLFVILFALANSAVVLLK
jgi:hypothetical protein